jgi:predicted CoA-binding protein
MGGCAWAVLGPHPEARATSATLRVVRSSMVEVATPTRPVGSARRGGRVHARALRSRKERMDLGAARELTSDEDIAALVRGLRRVAVLGVKTEQHAEQPAFYVARYLADAGVEVIPVPVYYPEVTTILGRPVFRSLASVPPPHVDLVDVFRRSSDVAAHLPDLLAARPRAVWLQLGIRDDRVAAELVENGIHVVQDRCLMVDHRRFAR